MPTDPGASGKLRALVPPAPPPVMTVVPKIPKRDQKMIEFYQQAISLGVVCTPLKDLKGEMGRQMTSRMVKRDGDKFLWQTGTPTMRLFLEEGTSFFPKTLHTVSHCPARRETLHTVSYCPARREAAFSPLSLL